MPNRVPVFARILALVAVLGAPSALAQPVVRILNWADYIDEATVPRFERASGIKATYETFDTAEELEERLLSGAPETDLTATGGQFLARQIKNGVFRPLDRSKLPNWRHLAPEVLRLLARFDPDNRHAVPYLWGTIGIGYNVAAMKDRMAEAPLVSLKQLFDPEVLARFSDCGIGFVDSPGEVVPAVLRHLGEDPDSKDPRILAKAEPVLQAIRPYVTRFNSTSYLDDLAGGGLCLVFGWSSDILQAMDNAKEAKRGVEIAYRIPAEGAAAWFDAFAIPAEAVNLAEAHRFLDFLLEPDTAARVTGAIGLANANAAATPRVDAEVRNNAAVYPPPEIMAKLFAVGPYDARAERYLTGLWARIKGKP
ncbi:MAG: extracellular solute-binding protein [Alphaproteobacteria bacterium]|nr:extracellular solute-binding protein [Alphaproteobacteria bacterium]